jgi:hypothetical protein
LNASMATRCVKQRKRKAKIERKAKGSVREIRIRQGRIGNRTERGICDRLAARCTSSSSSSPRGWYLLVPGAFAQHGVVNHNVLSNRPCITRNHPLGLLLPLLWHSTLRRAGSLLVLSTVWHKSVGSQLCLAGHCACAARVLYHSTWCGERFKTWAAQAH